MPLIITRILRIRQHYRRLSEMRIRALLLSFELRLLLTRWLSSLHQARLILRWLLNAPEAQLTAKQTLELNIRG